MSSRRKILLIDYDPESIESTRAPLVRAGYEVEVASDGVAGVEAFERLKPDLVLIEPMVPKKHGFQVCQEIKSTAAGRDTPVLITTGFYRGRKHRDEAHESCGCDDYLEKPIAEALLLSTCGKFLIDTQEPPIPVADEAAAEVPLAAPSPRPSGTGSELVDSLPDIPIPGEKSHSKVPALDDLTEDEIQERLDAMIIGEDRPRMEEPSIVELPQPEIDAVPVAAVEPLAPPVEVAETTPTPAAEPSRPVAPAEDTPLAVEPPGQASPPASPAVENSAVHTSDATVAELLARKPDRVDSSAAAVETAVDREPDVAPFVADETPERSRLPLWIGIAAGVFIVVGLAILWMLRDQDGGDPSIEVAAMSIGEASSVPSRAPASRAPLIPEPDVVPEAAVESDAAGEIDAGDPVLLENPEPGPGDEVGQVNVPVPPKTTQPVSKEPSPAVPEVVVEAKQEPSAGPPAKPVAEATVAAATVDASSTTATGAGDTIDDPAPEAAKIEPPEPETEAQADPIQQAVTPTEAAPEESATEEPAIAQSPPAEPPAPKTRQGDLVDLAELDRTPVAKDKPMPEYPAAAQSMRLEGTVNMRLLVDERGRVEQVEVASGTKSKQLQRAATKAAEQWVYEPGMKDGVPVKVWVTASVNFKF